MANAAQCYYCFECLSASYEDREHASLAAVEALWEQYQQSKKLASLGSHAVDEAALDEEEEDADEPCPPQSVNDDEDDGDARLSSQTSSRLTGLQVPRVRRLQSQMSDSSSAATTPSCTSNTSSNSLFSNSTAVTTPSAQSETLGSRQRFVERQHPLFVTWNTLSRSGHKSLRGCIGTFEPHDLEAGLKSYALTSYVARSLYFYCYTVQACNQQPFAAGSRVKTNGVANAGLLTTHDFPQFRNLSFLHCHAL